MRIHFHFFYPWFFFHHHHSLMGNSIVSALPFRPAAAPGFSLFKRRYFLSLWALAAVLSPLTCDAWKIVSEAFSSATIFYCLYSCFSRHKVANCSIGRPSKPAWNAYWRPDPKPQKRTASSGLSLGPCRGIGGGPQQADFTGFRRGEKLENRKVCTTLPCLPLLF